MIITTEDKDRAWEVANGFDRDWAPEDVFYHACFAVSSPQVSFEANSGVNKKLRDMMFYENGLDADALREVIRPLRFVNGKAKRLVSVRENIDWIVDLVSRTREEEATSYDAWFSARKTLVSSNRVKGFGMKTASHFLRNMGALDLAIIDRHVLNFLGKEKIQYTPQWYLATEAEFAKVAGELDVPTGILDIIVFKKMADIPWEDFDK